MEQFGGTFTDDVADYEFAPNTAGSVTLLLGESIDATEITVAPLASGWFCDVVVTQSGDDGDVVVTWANVSWFGGTPTIATGANAKTFFTLFSPDGVTVYGFGSASVAGVTVPQAPPSDVVDTSSQNATTN